MKKALTFISHWLMLLIIVFAHIGVNVNKLYCGHCEKIHAYVNVLPEEGKNCCERECECCRKDCPAPDCSYGEEKWHTFYKITDAYEVAEKFHVDIIYFSLPEEVRIATLFPVKTVDFSDFQEHPQSPPAQEYLCTYRC